MLQTYNETIVVRMSAEHPKERKDRITWKNRPIKTITVTKKGMGNNDETAYYGFG